MLQTNRYMLMFLVAFLSTQVHGTALNEGLQPSSTAQNEESYESPTSDKGYKNDQSSSYQQEEPNILLDSASTSSDFHNTKQIQLLDESMENSWSVDDSNTEYLNDDGSFSNLMQSMYIK